MPESLQAHIRYPQDYLLAQGLMFASYHMLDPEVFYNQEDLWVRATEKTLPPGETGRTLLRDVGVAWFRQGRVCAHAAIHTKKSPGHDWLGRSTF